MTDKKWKKSAPERIDPEARRFVRGQFRELIKDLKLQPDIIEQMRAEHILGQIAFLEIEITRKVERIKNEIKQLKSTMSRQEAAAELKSRFVA